jgi:hypothetical protein
MGMLAVEGTYDKLEALLDTGIHPVDLLLLMAASEGDIPKIEELLGMLKRNLLYLYSCIH